MANLTARDKQVLNDLHHFCGLYTEAVKKSHFDGKNYALERLSNLYNARYIDKEKYYVPTDKSARKMGTLYYLTPKGADAVDKKYREIDCDKTYLSSQYIVSRIYEQFQIQKVDEPIHGFQYQNLYCYFVYDYLNDSIKELKKYISSSKGTRFLLIVSASIVSEVNERITRDEVTVLEWTDNCLILEEIISQLKANSSV